MIQLEVKWAEDCNSEDRDANRASISGNFSAKGKTVLPSAQMS